MNPSDIYTAVQTRYSAAANASADDGYASKVAAAFGYTEGDLNAIPKGANLGLSCGNPLVVAGLREGEVVVDLGCGAGFDVFLASKKVHASGRAIGVDMNDDMLAKANRNKTLSKAQNVEFLKAPVTDISPLRDGSADCIISNCVINLVPEIEKQQAFNEMARILRPGGRVAISDILLKRDLFPALKRDMALYVGCIAGASKVESYQHYLHSAGFKDVLITETEKDLNVYKEGLTDEEGPGCCARPRSEPAGGNGQDPDDCLGDSAVDKPASVDFNEYAGAFNIYAVRT